MDRQERAWRRAREHATAAEGAGGGGARGRVSVAAVCAAAVPVMGVDGYGVSLVSGPGLRRLGCASDEVGALVEEAQLVCGQGPCTDAYTTLTPVLSPDLDAAAARWPGFVPVVVARGVGAVFAFPLQVAGVRIGAVDFYRSRPGELDADQAADAAAFAAVASAAAFASHPAPQRLAALTGDQPPHGFPPVVHQAAGMLAARLEIPVDEALLRLRAYAYLHDQPLTGTAHQVLHRRLTLRPHHEPEP
ncbi:ANTAR domain-containing protein [Actinomadura kijaniata]|uniref:ANTAR domain-containing protein n=1 Tax=Actinomadura kijaniata TaxID=46161 RepID=UPI003F1C3557